MEIRIIGREFTGNIKLASKIFSISHVIDMLSERTTLQLQCVSTVNIPEAPAPMIITFSDETNPKRQTKTQTNTLIIFDMIVQMSQCYMKILITSTRGRGRDPMIN